MLGNGKNYTWRMKKERIFLHRLRMLGVEYNPLWKNDDFRVRWKKALDTDKDKNIKIKIIINK